MFSSAHTCFMNSTVGEKQKRQKQKQICPAQSEIDNAWNWYNTWTTQSLKAWA